MNKVTQLKEAHIIIDENLKRHFDREMTTVCPEHQGFDGLYAIESDLNELLDRAQNNPPEGESDGTIGELRYVRMRRLLNSLIALRRDFDDWEGLK